MLYRANIAFAADESALSADERARADALRVPRERRRFVAGRVLTRQVLAEQLGISPREVKFAYGEHGKPRVIPPASWEGPGMGLYFNTSRSEDDWACAISTEGEIGVDVERVRELPELEAMICAYCPKREQEQLALRAGKGEAVIRPYDQKSRDFLVCWTRKEAVLKAIGAGLSIPPNQIDIFNDAAETEVVAQGRRWRVSTQILPSANEAGKVVLSVARG